MNLKRNNKWKKKLSKLVSLCLILCLAFSNSMTSVAMSSEKTNFKTVQRDKRVEASLCYYKFVKINYNDKNAMPNNINMSLDKNSIRRSGVVAAPGVYFIPGIGQVLLTVTGVIIVGGIVICAGTWVYNQVVKYFKEHSKNKSKKNHDKHTKPRPGRENEKKKDKDKGWKKRK